MDSSKATTRGFNILLTIIMGIAVVGYLVGINDGVPKEDISSPTARTLHLPPGQSGQGEDQAPLSQADQPASTEGELVSHAAVAIPATPYFEMRQADTGSVSRGTPNLTRIHSDNELERCIACHEPDSPAVRTLEEAKLQSLTKRSSRRAFNGAPPIIPHAIEGTSDGACMTCHNEGAVIGQLVANRMSHGPLANCLQCHAAPPPNTLAPFEQDPQNSFVGLAAPKAGPRAYPGAPPVIPHSTWMRDRCLSCHGALGWPGLEVTHSWRTNCRQCHATTTELEQGVAADPLDSMPNLAVR